jgi:hypothetical protein
MALDPRLITVGLQTSGGIKNFNQNLAITAKGTKYGSGIFGECEVTINNLDKATQDYILTETSPYNLNRTPKTVTVDAGRVSYGTSRIFQGTIVTSKPTQPPDIALVLRCIQNGYNSGNIVSRNQGQALMSVIAQQIALDNDLALRFEATDKLINNFNHTGAANQQINKLGLMGLVDAFQDNGTLVVKNRGQPLRGATRVISANTGMIGIPQLTERGAVVKFFLDNLTALGNEIEIKSMIQPAANGRYVIFNLDFDIASRDTPFYYIADCIRRQVPPT